MSGSILQVGLLGVGRIGTLHAEHLAKRSDVALCVADINPEAAAKLAGRLNVAHVGVDDMFASHPDALVIATSTDTHAELIARAAEARIRTVLCEKPIALDTADTRAALAAAEAAGLKLQIGFQRRFDPDHVAAHAALARNGLGRLHSIQVLSADPAPPPADYIPRSGGMFRDMLIHDFDALRRLTGQEIVWVRVAGGTLDPDDRFRRYGDVGTAMVSMQLSGGTMVSLNGTRYHAAGYLYLTTLIGENGTLVIGLDERSPLQSANPNVPWPGATAYESFIGRFRQAYQDEMDHFVRYARGDIDNPCTGENALQALRVALACKRSLAENRQVYVEEIQ
ncbi:MAG TPA: Gfo/Idh/MocA family oxidoreductase [Candidatus Saccharimonadia bacterium]|nr:Gfo/Idh/MocA family oxidoreductase [Candidatus Saccharimonadia bacterium]